MSSTEEIYIIRDNVLKEINDSFESITNRTGKIWLLEEIIWLLIENHNKLRLRSDDET